MVQKWQEIYAVAPIGTDNITEAQEATYVPLQLLSQVKVLVFCIYGQGGLLQQ